MKTPLAELCVGRVPFFCKGNVEMSLFLKAAQAWQKMVATEYHITAGRKRKTVSFSLDFDLADFPHLAGMQYAQDVDFNLRPSEYYGEKLIPALLSGKMDGNKIEKSRNWERIKGRLNAIIGLQDTLDSEFAIALFDPARVHTNSRIDADYIIQNLHSGEIYFVFIDENKEHRHYCKSAFAKNNVDYMKNQPLLTVLKKEKIENGVSRTLFQHPNFKEQTEAVV